jgi:hypothetical protein
VKGTVYLEDRNIIYSFGDDGKIVRWKIINEETMDTQKKTLCTLIGGTVKDL